MNWNDMWVFVWYHHAVGGQYGILGGDWCGVPHRHTLEFGVLGHEA